MLLVYLSALNLFQMPLFRGTCRQFEVLDVPLGLSLGWLPTATLLCSQAPADAETQAEGPVPSHGARTSPSPPEALLRPTAHILCNHDGKNLDCEFRREAQAFQVTELTL